MTRAAVRQPLSDTGRGIAWMLITTVLFVAMDTLAKHLTSLYPVPEVVWARFAFHALFVTLLMGPSLRTRIVTRRPGLQFLRSALLEHHPINWNRLCDPINRIKMLYLLKMASNFIRSN